MNKPLWLLLPVLTLQACGKERSTSDDTGPLDTDATPECVDDGDCGSYRICEDAVCRLGDRDNTFDDAGNVFQITGDEDPNVRKGMIHAPGDVDHWAYESAGDEWLRVWTRTDETVETGLDTVVSVYAPNGSLHHYLDEFGTGSLRSYDTLMHVYLPTPGRWIFKIEDRTTFFDEPARGGETFLYDFGVEAWGSVTREPDSAEDPDVSYTLANGSTIYPWGLVIDSPGDVDHTTATMPFGDAPFEVWAPEVIPGSPLQPRIEVEADGQLVMAKDNVGSGGPATYFDGWQTTWTLRARDVSPERGGPGNWTVLYLRTRTEGSGNPREVEPNDLAGDATVLDQETVTESGNAVDRSFFQGRLMEGDTEDWYAFQGRDGGSLRTACSSSRFGALGDVQVELVGPDETRATFDDGDDLAPDIDGAPLTAGTWRVRFTEKSGLGGPGVYYRCGLYVDH